jgi:hypothetical protein
MHGDGVIGKAGDINAAVRCFSVSGQLASYEMMAVNAATYLDIVRSGQTTFPVLTDKIESAKGARSEEMNGLSLAESAPTNVSSDQLGRSFYKQCSSYAALQ